MRVIIVGGGVIGISTAYALSKRGIGVTVLERGEIGHGASFGNAVLLVPSYSLPLTTTGNIVEGMRALVGLPSAVGIKVWPTPSMVAWAMRFAALTRKDSLARRLEVVAALTQRSLALFDDYFAASPAPDVDYSRDGVLYVCRTEHVLAQSVALSEQLQTAGITSVVLDAAQMRAHEPALSREIAGGIWYPGDARLQPLRFVEAIAQMATASGVEIRNDRVTGLLHTDRIANGVQTVSEALAADRVILAAGAWSPDLVRSLGLNLPIVPAKGTASISNLANPPQIAMLLNDDHVSLTPMNDRVRATTGLDFHGYDDRIDDTRFEKMLAAYQNYLDAPVILEEGPRWAGFRPLTPDGLPIIGPSSRIGNLFYATGHGALGITLAPVTAQLITEAISSDARSIHETLLPKRFNI